MTACHYLPPGVYVGAVSCSVMDLVGATASIAQLAAYGHSVIQRLLHLYEAIRTGPAVYRDQKSNISILLDIVHRTCDQDSTQGEVILPLLVDISALACRILNLLDRKGFLGLNWTLLIRHEILSEAFTSLNGKRDLLHLHISERNQTVLSQIRIDIAKINGNFLAECRQVAAGATSTTTTVEDTPVELTSQQNGKENNSSGNTQGVCEIRD